MRVVVKKLASIVLQVVGAIVAFRELLQFMGCTWQVSGQIVLGLTVGFSVLLFLLDGFWLSGFLLGQVTLVDHSNGMQIKIRYGDVLSRKGLVVVPVNEFFDGLVQGTIVSPKSVHGQMLNRFWPNEARLFESTARKSLSEQGILSASVSKRKEDGCTDKYPIGSVAEVRANESVKFLCVALSNTDPMTNVASGDMFSVIKALRGVLEYARQNGGGTPLFLPVMGSGLSKTGLHRMFLLNLIVQQIFDETKRHPIDSSIEVVLYNGDKGKFDIKAVKDSWRG